MSYDTQIECRRDPRTESQKPVEFIVDADMIEGSSVNVSESGVRITTHAPIEVELRFGEGEPIRASLVWARQNSEGGCEYGFEYFND